MIEDFDAYFADFGVAATLPNSAVVRGVFDDGYVDLYGTAQSAKVFTTSAAGIAALAQGQTLSIGAVSYTVAEIQPDGTGLARVLLK